MSLRPIRIYHANIILIYPTSSDGRQAFLKAFFKTADGKLNHHNFSIYGETYFVPRPGQLKPISSISEHIAKIFNESLNEVRKEIQNYYEPLQKMIDKDILSHLESEINMNDD